MATMRNEEVLDTLQITLAEVGVRLGNIEDTLTEVRDLSRKYAAFVAQQDERWEAHWQIHKGLATKDGLDRLLNGVANGKEALKVAHKNEISAARLAAMMGGSGTIGATLAVVVVELIKLLSQKP